LVWLGTSPSGVCDWGTIVVLMSTELLHKSWSRGVQLLVHVKIQYELEFQRAVADSDR
jgi:hypothetical protein